MQNLKVLAIIAVIIVVGVLSYIFVQNTHIDVIVIDNEFEGWQTYQNEEYGFEVKYPPGWSFRYFDYLDHRNPSIEKIFDFQSDPEFYVNISFVNEADSLIYHPGGKRRTLDEFINSETSRIRNIAPRPESGGGSRSFPQKVIFAEVPAAIQTAEGAGLMGKIITIPQLAMRISTNGDFSEKNEKIIDQILSTFKFIQ